MNELDIARAISEGKLDSPQQYGNLWLFAIRITGTGVAFRDKANEFCYRNPENYLNDDFLARCAGLPVIWFHADTPSELLDSTEYGRRAIGAVMFAYILGEEVWAIARVYDEDAAREMTGKQLSTSPSVQLMNSALTDLPKDDSFTEEMQCYNITSEETPKLLIEGKPALLDHIAICLHGVWDKGGEPLGVSTQQIVRNDSMNTETQTPAPAAEVSPSDIMKLLQTIVARLEKLEGAEVAEAEGHTEAASGLGNPEFTAADNAEDMQRNKSQADDCNYDDDDDDNDKKAEMEKVVADALAKQGSQYAAQIAALEKRIPSILSDAEMNEVSAIQFKADSTASALGITAPRPMPGEKPLNYRQRALAFFQKHSNDWKGIDLKALPAQALGIAEQKIYADSMEAANSVHLSDGLGLRESIHRPLAGGAIITFKGKMSDWTNQFKGAQHRLVGINTKG